MPARPPVPGVVQVVVQFRQSGSAHNIVNKLHFTYTGGAPAVVDLTSFANKLFGFFANLAPNLSTDTTLQTVTVTDIGAATGNIGISTSAAVAGTGPTPIPSAAIAGVINWIIARRYRGGKPKTFIGGLSGGNTQTETTINASFTTALQTLASNLTTVGSAYALQTYGAMTITALCNVSYFFVFTNYTKSNQREASRPLLRTTPLVDPVVNYKVSPAIGIQRRRRLAS